MAKTTIVFSAKASRWKLELRTRSNPVDDLAGLRSILGERVPSDGLKAAFETTDAQTAWTSFDEPMEPSGKGRWTGRPRVFENRQYSLKIEPADGCAVESVSHPISKEIDDALDCDDGRIWRAGLRTGNDIGWFSLEIVSECEGIRYVDRVAWQVWPLKLDYAGDLREIVESIERTYPLWLFRFVSPTESETGRSDRPRGRFLLLWLKQFQASWERLERGVKTVLREPHQRLEQKVSFLRADRIHGRIRPRLEERIAEGRHDPRLRHRLERPVSSLDTAENRFVKHVLGDCLGKMERVVALLKDAPLAASFHRNLSRWDIGLRAASAAPLFRSVGAFDGLTQESLVLHQRAGYSAVYRSWLELRHDLEFFANQPRNRIGMRPISELYEIWCFLELRRLLMNLGFTESLERAPKMRVSAFDRSIADGMGAAFRLEHPSGLSVRLAHEPVFGKPKGAATDSIHSYTVAQKTDIVLEAVWPASTESVAQKLVWVFDAKYRIKSDARDWENERDDRSEDPLVEHLAPPDAIDQMHRYRDSLILRHAGNGDKTRPVIGAYALYPGVFDQTKSAESNPYRGSVKEVGIGAFPLVPGTNGSKWLEAHLREALGIVGPIDSLDAGEILAREEVRIPVSGLVYQDEDLLLVPLFDRAGKKRSAAYYAGFRDGTATGYHTMVKGGPRRERLEKVRWLAAIVPEADNTGVRKIHGVFRVSPEIRKCPRGELSIELTGTASERSDASEYHVLDFDSEWFPLPAPLEVKGLLPGNWFRYTRFDLLQKARDISDLKIVRERPRGA